MHFYYLSNSLLWLLLKLWSNIAITVNLYLLEYSYTTGNHIFEFYILICSDWSLEENDITEIDNQSSNRTTLAKYIYYG